MQQAFVAAYLLTLNATSAAIAAGYSKDTAKVQGCQLLNNPSLAKVLRQAMARRAKRLELTADNVLREISRIAFSDIRAIVDFDNQGVSIKSSKKIHSDAAVCIQSVEQHTNTTETSSNTTVKVKLHDKMKALELAAKHLGLNMKTDEEGPYRAMTLAELKALVKAEIMEDEKPK